MTKYNGCWASEGGDTLLLVEGPWGHDLAEGGAVGAELASVQQGLVPGRGPIKERARTRDRSDHTSSQSVGPRGEGVAQPESGLCPGGPSELLCQLPCRLGSPTSTVRLLAPGWPPYRVQNPCQHIMSTGLDKTLSRALGGVTGPHSPQGWL